LPGAFLGDGKSIAVKEESQGAGDQIQEEVLPSFKVLSRRHCGERSGGGHRGSGGEWEGVWGKKKKKRGKRCIKSELSSGPTMGVSGGRRGGGRLADLKFGK